MLTYYSEREFRSKLSGLVAAAKSHLPGDEVTLVKASRLVLPSPIRTDNLQYSLQVSDRC